MAHYKKNAHKNPYILKSIGPNEIQIFLFSINSHLVFTNPFILQHKQRLLQPHFQLPLQIHNLRYTNVYRNL